MPTENITVHYNGAEYRVTHWERERIKETVLTGRPAFWTLNPFDDVEIALGPGAPVHFSIGCPLRATEPQYAVQDLIDPARRLHLAAITDVPATCGRRGRAFSFAP